MNAPSPTFWKRLTDRLRPQRHPQEQEPGLPEIGDDGLLAEPADRPGDSEMPGAKAAGPLARWTKRDQTLAKLQEGYEQVTQLIGDIRNHLATQADRSERICTSLEQLARSMSDVPAISRQQTQTLETMADQLQTSNARTQQLAETMSDLPKVARAQTDTLAGISRQMEMANEQNLVASQTMDKLGAALHSLGQSNQAQAGVLKQMETKGAEQNDVLTRLIARQGRRFVMLFIVTVVLAAAAIATGVAAIVLRSG